MSTATDSILQQLADGQWWQTAMLAEACGLMVRSCAQSLRHLVNEGRVERSEDTPFQFRLTSAEAGSGAADEVVVEEAVAPASFAIWGDASMSVTRSQDSMYLTPADVTRLRAHLARFFDGTATVAATVPARRIEG
jgi:hypothetical protein